MRRRYERAQRLAQRVVILAGSVPESLADRGERAFDVVEEAVLSIARTVFGAGGRIAFAGDADIETLLAVVANEYRDQPRLEEFRERPAAPPLIVHEDDERGRGRRERKPDDVPFSADDERIEELHLVSGDAEPRPARAPEFVEEPDAVALVCVGGSEKRLRRQVEAFEQEHGSDRIFVLRSTGGGAARLAAERPELSSFEDALVEENAEANRPRRERGERPAEGDVEIRAVYPYPLIAARIVERLVS